MASALIAGALQSGILNSKQLLVIETSSSQKELLAKRFPGLQVQSDAVSASQFGRIILAVKPQVLREIGPSLSQSLSGDRLWVSIAAGVGLDELSLVLGSKRVVRVMPNTASQVGAGAAGIAASDRASESDLDWVTQFMRSVGTCERVAESQMHAVTGVSGSGPAYIYMIIESLSDAGVAGGLPRAVSTRLAAQTVLGAAQMVLKTGQHPGQLKDQVTSPAGTTIEAIRVLEAAGLRSAMMEAVAACIERSKELEVK